MRRYSSLTGKATTIPIHALIISLSLTIIIYISVLFVLGTNIINSSISIPLIIFFLIYFLSILSFDSHLNPLSIHGSLLLLSVTDYIIKVSYGADILRYVPGLDPSRIEYYRTSGITMITFWIVVIYVSFLFFYHSNAKNLNSFLSPKKPLKEFVLQRSCFVLLIISILSFLYIFVHMGGIAGMVTAMVRRSVHYQGLGYMRELVQLSGVAAVIFLYRQKRLSSFIVLICSFIMTAMLGGRGSAFLGIVIPYLFVWTHYKRRISIATLSIWTLVGISFLIGMEFFKFGGRSLSLDFTSVLLSVGRGAADILPSMIHALDSDLIDFQLGKTLLGIPLVFIPRAIWKGKPTGLGEDALLGRAFIGENYWGLPPGPFGVAYLNFSIFGLILFSIAIGYLSAKLYLIYRSYAIRKEVNTFTIIYPFIFINIFSFFTVYSALSITFKSILIGSILFISHYRLKTN